MSEIPQSQIDQILDFFGNRAFSTLEFVQALSEAFPKTMRALEDLISAKPQPRKLEAWRKSGSAQGLQPIIA